MIKALIREFPVTDILDDMTEEKIRKYAYTKDEVDALIAEAVAEARRIDEASMAKHNREATVISMILGFTALHYLLMDFFVFLASSHHLWRLILTF